MIEKVLSCFWFLGWQKRDEPIPHCWTLTVSPASPHPPPPCPRRQNAMVLEVGIWVEIKVKSDLYFAVWDWHKASAKKGGKKGSSAIKEVVTWEHNIPKHMHGSAFRNCALRAPKRWGNLPWRTWELQMYAWTPGSTRNVPQYLSVVVQKT